jgi:hypothetical protein
MATAEEFTVSDVRTPSRKVVLARFSVAPDGSVQAHYFDAVFQSEAEGGIPLHEEARLRWVTPADGPAFIQALEHRYARSSTTVVSRARPLPTP